MNGTEYLADVYTPSRVGLRSGSIQQLQIAASHLDAFSGGVSIDQWTPELVTRWMQAMHKAGMSGSTINSKRRAILTLWRHAFDQGRHPAFPRGIAKAREPKRAPRAWTADEVGAILQVCRGQRGMVADLPAADWWESLVLACYDTGQRISALRTLPTEDCDLNTGWILIRAEAQKVAADMVCGLAADTIEAIGRIYDAARDCVWPWPWHPNTLWSRFKRIVLQAGVRYPAKKSHCDLFHRFRRTSGTLVDAAGGNGAKHLGNSPAVFVQSYLDPTLAGSQVHLLPRPVAPQPTFRVVG
jgi:integrase